MTTMDPALPKFIFMSAFLATTFRKMQIAWIFLFLFCLVFSGCTTGRLNLGSPEIASGTPATSDSEQVSALSRAIVARLELAPRVAWIKYQNELPVSDPEREATQMEAILGQAAERNMDEQFVHAVFLAQMAASRQWQSQLLRQWRRGGELPAYPPQSLIRDIRPEIETWNREILAELQRGKPELPAEGLGNRIYADLRERDVPASVARIAVRPLR